MVKVTNKKGWKTKEKWNLKYTGHEQKILNRIVKTNFFEQYRHGLGFMAHKKDIETVQKDSD